MGERERKDRRGAEKVAIHLLANPLGSLFPVGNSRPGDGMRWSKERGKLFQGAKAESRKRGGGGEHEKKVSRERWRGSFAFRASINPPRSPFSLESDRVDESGSRSKKALFSGGQGGC